MTRRDQEAGATLRPAVDSEAVRPSSSDMPFRSGHAWSDRAEDRATAQSCRRQTNHCRAPKKMARQEREKRDHSAAEDYRDTQPSAWQHDPDTSDRLSHETPGPERS